MFSTTITGALIGVSAYMVNVEVDVSTGLPGFNMVGSLSAEIREARERVCVTLKNLGIDIPPMRITVNLAPADKRKDGTAFDLPIAVGLLKSLEIINPDAIENALFLGELGLNGEIKSVKGILPIVRQAKEEGIKTCFVPIDNVNEAIVIPGMTIKGVASMEQLLKFLWSEDQEKNDILPDAKQAKELSFEEDSLSDYDFLDVAGQENAKRAAIIAAAGFHNLLMVGPPGVGKSMIARRISSILPLLNLEESLEVTSIYSVAGLIEKNKSLIMRRPFQSPHHTVTLPALTGGSRIPKPGIISLAHRGVLFLDELPEFKRDTIDALRQPLEEKSIHIARVNGNVEYPADIMLVCAMNPCPCGYYPDLNRCKCSQTAIRKYVGKISGPIMDRIDLCVDLERVDVRNMGGNAKGESSKSMREKVCIARKMQMERFENTRLKFNSDMDAAAVEKYCVLGKNERDMMDKMYDNLKLSARAYHRVLKVARTIADLEGEEAINSKHLLEASCYRVNLGNIE